jgi:uncharacterized protein YcaQ
MRALSDEELNELQQQMALTTMARKAVVHVDAVVTELRAHHQPGSPRRGDEETNWLEVPRGIRRLFATF